MNKTEPNDDHRELISEYKRLLRDVIERRPSGLRLKISEALGTHKSFVSLITNPNDPTPVPSRHIPTLLSLCQFQPAEEATFLAAYQAAHKTKGQRRSPRSRAGTSDRVVEIRVPSFSDSRKQKEFEAMLRQFAQSVANLIDK